jgi:branched-chain amino acid aminotransferase
VIWIDGRLTADDEAKVSVLDHGVTVGDGVFETMRVYAGRAFAVGRHLDRLVASASTLGLPQPDRHIAARAVAEVVAANSIGEGRVRVTWTGGVGPLGSRREGGRPTMIATVGPIEPIPPTTTAVTVPWARNERSPLVGVKTTSYAENVVALERARSAGATEALLGNTVGDLCEGTGSNVFIVLGGRLLTPPLSSGCLAGVTRALVLECCEVTEATVPLDALVDADEVFLTSSTREVQGITGIDDRDLPGQRPITERCAGAYRALVARDIDP